MIPTYHIGQAGRPRSDAGFDPHLASVVLLVDASSRANGSTPSDIDFVGKTPTWSGNAQCKTDDFRFGSSSLYFDGTGDSLDFADSADWTMGTGDATWEWWAKYSGATNVTRVFLSQENTADGFYSIQAYNLSSDGRITAFVSNGSTSYGSTGGGVTNNAAWRHYAVVRSGADLYSYFDGGRFTHSTLLSGVSLMNASRVMCIGRAEKGNTAPYLGWMDQIRITKGVARYTGPNIIVPTSPWPKV